MQRLAKRRSLRTWDIAALFSGRSDFSVRLYPRKIRSSHEIPTPGKFVDVSQEYITRFAFATGNDLFTN